ncbi:MAG: hypothetical protein ABI418_13740, partial [Jatrophihabitantaceae bacterium]
HPPAAGSIFDDPNAADPALRLVLARLRATTPDSAPEPSGELLAALAALRPGTVTPLAAGRSARLIGHRRQSRTSRYHKVILTVAGAAAVAVPATGVAAANDGLPRPAERVVSRVVNDWTPFTIVTDDPPSSPPHHRPAGSSPSPTGTPTTSPRQSGESDDPSSPGPQLSTQPGAEDPPDQSPQPTGTASPTGSPHESEPSDDRTGGNRTRPGSATPTASHTTDR